MIPREPIALMQLVLLLLLSLLLASRWPIRSGAASRIAPVAGLVLTIQLFHVAEEFMGDFQRRFPQLFGFQPWSDQFFLSLNLTAIAIWALAILGLAHGKTSFAVRAAVWFLAITAFANGLAHPAVSMVARTVFPGLFSSIPLGLAGLMLLRLLVRADRRGPQS